VVPSALNAARRSGSVQGSPTGRRKSALTGTNVFSPVPGSRQTRRPKAGSGSNPAIPLPPHRPQLSPFATTALGLILGGCSSGFAVPSTTPIASPVQAPTPTFVFPTAPATTTPSPAPSPSPTPDRLLGLGPYLYQDDFSRNDGWPIGQDSLGGTSFADGRLVIAVRKSGTYRYAQSPSPALTDFFVQVSVRPFLCGPSDDFGLMFRMDEDSNHFRFILACDGQARVARVLNGQSFNLIPPTDTYAAIPGPLSENRLGVLAKGSDFFFFINDVEVFSLRSGVIPAGGLGLFVHSAASGQTTVAFDDLSARAVAQDLTSASPAPSTPPNPSGQTP